MARKMRVYSKRPTVGRGRETQVKPVRSGPSQRTVRTPSMSRSSEQTQASRWHR